MRSLFFPTFKGGGGRGWGGVGKSYPHPTPYIGVWVVVGCPAEKMKVGNFQGGES